MMSMTRNLQAQIASVAVRDHDTGAGSTGPGRPSDDWVLCVRTKPQAGTNKLEVPELLKVPPDDEPWADCLVLANKLESDGFWAQIKHLPPIHVVGKSPDGKYCMVAVASSRFQILRDLDLPFLLGHEHLDVSEPTEGEVKVHGIAEAREKSQRRYVEKAVAGVLSSQHRGLDLYYRDNTKDQSLLLPIEWAILIRDVKAASPEVRSHFYNSCCFLTLHLPNAFDDETSRELINRNDESWMERIESTMMVWPVEGSTMEFHQVSLVRALLESAGGREDTLQRRLDKTRSANENLAILGDLFGVELTEPVSFGRCRASGARQNLSEASDSDDSKAPCKTKDPLGHTAFKCGKRSVMELRDHVALYLPIWFSNAVYEALPADLINDLSHEAVTGAQAMSSYVSRNMTGLGNPESSLPLLIFHCANMSVDNVPLRKWMASAKGKKVYRQLTATLRESQAANQIALCLAALISYDLVLGSADENPGPINGSYLGDFLQQLNGYELNNRRRMWEQMICSFRRVRTCHGIADNWLDTACRTQPSHGLDKFSDWYWEHRSEGTHDFALQKVCDYLDKERDFLRRCGRSGEEDGRDPGEKTGEDLEGKMEEEYVVV
ncbi:hypothetical protein NCS52_01546900 [Fusarium sp. LHS14.1]|nr:hypothetical protein NCS52_01546900 [Fusarium sp. LHS14.1]